MAAMAAVKSKTQERTVKKDEKVGYVKESESHTFHLFDLCLVVLSLCTFVADLVTDIILVISYFNHGHKLWGCSTLLLIVLPAIVIQGFSMRWHMTDKSVTIYHWIAHLCLLGLVHRYVTVLRTGVEARATGDPADLQRLYHQQSDICMLHLFESFMESAPQLVLQLYILITVQDWWSWTGVSAAASLGSLAWGLAAYARAMRRARPDKRAVSLPALALQAAWRAGLLAARLAALALLAAGFGAWLLPLMGVHWLCMTTWIVFQRTDFCPSAWEERVYNCVVGVIYCFCFFNLKEGRSRRRALAFYAVTVAQNLACLGAYAGLAPVAATARVQPWLAPVAGAVVVGGTVLGLTSMLLYYRFCHPAGPIPLCADVEKAVPVTGPDKPPPADRDSDTLTIRSLKHRWQPSPDRGRDDRMNNAPHDDSGHADDNCTDKKLLLKHWVSCPTATPSESAEGACEDDGEDVRRHKRRGICPADGLQLGLGEGEASDDRRKRRAICSLEPQLETELGLETPQTDADSSELIRQKRRGICSSADLCLELEQEAKHLAADASDAKVVVELNAAADASDCSDEPAAAPEGDGLELVSGKELSSAVLLAHGAEEIQSAPSEVLSAHDYENICAVNIAREAWGLRSWRGYCDIETWLHDDSVFRDRRRDTLTSTATTLTSASSERSGSPPPPVPCRRPAPRPPPRSRQDDYLDTLADDLVDCDRALAEFVAEPDGDGDANLYVARPYLIDQHGALFPLSTLDTIMEELEESSTDTGESVWHWHKHGSASTLVATIDEIRHGGSICNLYNSSDPLWNACASPLSDSADTLEEATTCGEATVTAAAYGDSFMAPNHSHLSPEEVLFLSKLQAASPEQTPQKPSTDAEPRPVARPPEQEAEEAKQATPKIKKVARSRAHCKFLLLREKFEARQGEAGKHCGRSADHPTPGGNFPDCEAGAQAFSGSTEALVPHGEADKPHQPAVVHRIHQWNNYLKTHGTSGSKCHDNNQTANTKSSFSNLKERRSLFLKQVLSPPKFQSWSKKGNVPLNSVQLKAS